MKAIDKYVVLAAQAHSNLNTWAAVVAILENSQLYGRSDQHKAASRVITIAKREQQKFLVNYDTARATVNKEAQP